MSKLIYSIFTLVLFLTNVALSQNLVCQNLFQNNAQVQLAQRLAVDVLPDQRLKTLNKYGITELLKFESPSDTDKILTTALWMKNLDYFKNNLTEILNKTDPDSLAYIFLARELKKLSDLMLNSDKISIAEINYFGVLTNYAISNRLQHYLEYRNHIEATALVPDSLKTFVLSMAAQSLNTANQSLQRSSEDLIAFTQMTIKKVSGSKLLSPTEKVTIITLCSNLNKYYSENKKTNADFAYFEKLLITELYQYIDNKNRGIMTFSDQSFEYYLQMSSKTSMDPLELYFTSYFKSHFYKLLQSQGRIFKLTPVATAIDLHPASLLLMIAAGYFPYKVETQITSFDGFKPTQPEFHLKHEQGHFLSMQDVLPSDALSVYALVMPGFILKQDSVRRSDLALMVFHYAIFEISSIYSIEGLKNYFLHKKENAERLLERLNKKNDITTTNLKDTLVSADELNEVFDQFANFINTL